MARDHFLVAVVTVAYLGAFCCDNVSGSWYSFALPSLYNPKELQCTWLYRANPEDCHSYYQCLHGQAVLRRCPKQLHWNAEGHYCDHKARTACKVGKDPTATSNSLLGVTDKVPKDCTPGTFKPSSTDCSKYYVCDRTWKEQPCNPGLHWNSVHSVCDWPANAGCTVTGTGVGQEVTTTTSTTTSTTPAPSTLPPFIPPTAKPTWPPTTNRPNKPTPPAPVWTTTEKPTTTSTIPTTIRPRPSPPSQTGGDATQYPILVPDPNAVIVYKTVCYYTNWSVYRKGYGYYEPSHIDPSLCTHIIYAFACLNPITYKIEMCDPWIDGEEGKNHYGQITAFRKLGVKVIIAVGGWNDSAYSKWNLLLKDVFKMETFINSICAFLLKHGFDGIDFDYEYPRCPQALCNFDSRGEKEGFVNLIRGVRLRCGPTIIISAAVSCNEYIIREAYDVKTLSNYLDFFNVMAYDYHGAWESKTGMNAPYQMASNNEEHHLNVRHSIQVYKEMGCPAEKLILGIPTYAQTFKLANALQNGIGAKTTGPGDAGQYTNQKGIMARYEYCTEKWHKVSNFNENRVGSYRINMTDGRWVSHDDRWSIAKKCEFVKTEGLGGAMIWSLDMDDFENRCGEGRYFMLSLINKYLRGPGDMEPPPPPPARVQSSKLGARGKATYSVRKGGSSSSGGRTKVRNSVSINSNNNKVGVTSSNGRRQRRRG